MFFLAQYTNVRYCLDCQQVVRAAQDKDVWQRRKVKTSSYCAKQCDDLEDRYPMQKERGIPLEFFSK